MKQNIQSISKQGGKTIRLTVTILFFMLLSYVSIGVLVSSIQSLSSFYEKKCEELGQVSIEAVLSKEQANEKVDYFFEDTEYESITKRDAISLEDAEIKLYEEINTDVLLMKEDEEIHFVEGPWNGENGIVLPYRLKSFYGMKKSNRVTIKFGGKSYEYVISGFYEDEIFSQQDYDEILTIYMNTKDYEQFMLLENVQEKLIYSIQLKNPEETNQVLTTLGQQMKEQLFISGLDLELYGSEELKTNTDLYLSYVQKVCVLLSSLFALIGIIGSFLMMNRIMKDGDVEIHKNRVLLYCVEGGGAVLGILTMLFLLPNIFAYMIRSLGYGFQLHSPLLSILITSVIYLVIMVLLYGLRSVRLQHTKAQKEPSVIKESNKNPVTVKEFIVVVFASILLSIPAIIVTQAYGNTMGHNDLFYQYDEEEDLVEVFHSDTQQEERQNQFTDLIEYVSPIIKVATYGLLILIALAYILVLYILFQSILHRLQQMEVASLKVQALTILGRILLASLFGFLIAMMIAPICMELMLAFLHSNLGITFDSFRINYILSLFLFAGFAVLASGVTVIEVQ